MKKKRKRKIHVRLEEDPIKKQTNAVKAMSP